MDNDAKKELILNTAVSLLAKNGFAKTTLDDIANALGMKKSSLYYYYENKEALLRDVINREQVHFCSMLKDAIKDRENLADKLIYYETVKFEHVAQSVKLHLVNANVLLEFKSKMFEQLDIIREKELKMFQEVFDDAMKKKEIVKCDTKRIAKTLLSISEALRHREFYYSTFSMNYNMNFENARDEMILTIQLVLNGILVNKK
ncbi:MAG: TetR/AcrR family transcriptional regulator [Ignavibacteriaceae bacterium]